MSDDSSIDRAISVLTQKIDRLDVLINNAGVYPDKQVDSLTVSRELLNTAMQTNTFGVIQMVQACLPLLGKSSHVEYHLTDFGLRFMPILDSIEELQHELEAHRNSKVVDLQTATQHEC